MEVFVGVDWAEEHHDVCVMDTGGRVRAKGRVSNDLVGIAKLHDLIAGAASDISHCIQLELAASRRGWPGTT